MTTTDILFDAPGNPVPANADAGWFHASDKRRLRYATFRATTGKVKGTILLLSGRNEYIEKYFETIRDLQKRGFDVAIKDWRGQGRSDRLLRDPARGYVRDFDDYVSDLIQFLTEHVEGRLASPCYLLGHSTGGLVALLAAPELNGRIRRMVLSAPLLSLAGFPISMNSISRIGGLLRLLGLGWIYAAGGPRRRQEFVVNKVTSDIRRYERNTSLIDTFPDLSMGGPTFSWVNRVCVAAGKVLRPTHMANIGMPILFIAAGNDEVVSTSTIEAYARALKTGSLVTIDGARHEILQERDIYREQFFAAFDAFIPGGGPPVSAG